MEVKEVKQEGERRRSKERSGEVRHGQDGQVRRQGPTPHTHTHTHTRPLNDALVWAMFGGRSIAAPPPFPSSSPEGWWVPRRRRTAMVVPPIA